MSVKELLQNITQDYSTENIIQLFRLKTTKFRQINEEENQYDNEFFSKGLQLGEIELTNNEDIVIYTFQSSKELTERSGKKAQYELAKSILKSAQRYSAGFFIFYDDKNDFRFSLIYDIPQSNGNREWSNFKRFTYYVSKDQTNKTFVNRLESADFSTIEKIKEAFSVEKVTKEFYLEIANWYFWSLKYVRFPKDAEVEKNGRNIALIRFITRIIFIWFMKQKNLISNNLFDKIEINKTLKSLSDKESTYYKAILQNLFFATLNTPIKGRKFRREHAFQGKNEDYMEHNYYRYHNLFNNPDDMLKIFANIPFLNGGLFECLDKRADDPSNDTGNEIRIDGFSDMGINQTIFPNYLFFSDEQEVDLNKDYGTISKRFKVRGLLNILQSYNFTIDENIPTDEEIALDPELLGRVFENLLASYNPETASTARKATGSYYTPREIVNYMVDESLIAYLKNKMLEGAKIFIELGTKQSDMFGNNARIGQLKIEEELKPSRWIDNEDNLEQELQKLISYSDDPVYFSDQETNILINSINNCKILDPAVGSGAFPMGVLHKLVLILSKLDPHNIKWEQQQILAIDSNVTDPKLKHELIEKIEESFRSNELDYGRKLYLIQNCLYGVDIQPIAIQIAKLRFFISLMVDEKVHNERNNFGIEPLPNLETKLLAANTLIGLTQDMTFKPVEIEILEKQLFEVRRNYFVTSNEKIKKELEKKDREIRQKIKILLVKNGFSSKYSEDISNWDPYNTNNAADWFDPEWMFGPDVKVGFNIVIGNPPYLESRSSNFDDKLKNRIQNAVKDRWNSDSQFIGRGSDLLIYFFERSISLINTKGWIVLITENAWLDTDYGKNFQSFLLKHTFVYKVIDSEFKHFDSKDGPNVNTVITIFFGNTVVRDKSILFIKYPFTHSNDVKKGNFINNFNVSPIIKSYSYEDETIATYKWGILLKSENIFLNTLEKLNKMGKNLGQLKTYSFSIGQGLNLTKDHFIDAEIVQNEKGLQNVALPILTSDDGAPFAINSTNKYLIPKRKLSKHDMILIKRYNLKTFDHISTSKKPPVLILPRGIGRHFCAFNLNNSYSSSFVEIYDYSISNTDQIKLRLWLFLNSSLFWLIRELSGRKNLGGGMLKAEATDLKSFPLYFQFDDIDTIENLFNYLSDKESLSPLEEILTQHHQQIDSIVFKFLNIKEEQQIEIINSLKQQILTRTNKSKT